MRRIARTQAVLAAQAIQSLRPSNAIPSHPSVVAGRAVVRCARKSVAALNGEILTGGLLKSNLKGVIPRIGSEIREAVECAIKLRIRPQQIEQRYGRIVVPGIR